MGKFVKKNSGGKLMAVNSIGVLCKIIMTKGSFEV
jgi:hypothetical protein